MRLGGVLGASWGCLGGLLGVLDASWRRLGASWGRLGGVDDVLEASGKRPGGVLEASWPRWLEKANLKLKNLTFTSIP